VTAAVEGQQQVVKLIAPRWSIKIQVSGHPASQGINQDGLAVKALAGGQGSRE
jgi:hypothetical protein